MDGNFKSRFGRRIKELRLAEGLTQEQLAEKMGIERTYLARIETGKHFPSAENIEKFALVFNTAPADLFETNHFHSRETLIKEILQLLNSFEADRLQYIYKAAVNLKNIR